MTDTAPLCGCGLPQSRNPHPDAGKPNAAGVAVGYTWECIPCLVKTRNRVGVKWRAEQAENARLRDALERIAKEPAPGWTVACSNIAKTALTGTRHDPHGEHFGSDTAAES